MSYAQQKGEKNLHPGPAEWHFQSQKAGRGPRRPLPPFQMAPAAVGPTDWPTGHAVSRPRPVSMVTPRQLQDAALSPGKDPLSKQLPAFKRK